MSSSSPSSKTLAGDASHSPAATWTESDELGLLRAVLEIALEPAEAFDPRISLFTRIKRNLGGKKFTSSDILAKVKELRRRYENGGAPVGEAFDISHRIWGLEKETEKQLTKQLGSMEISKDASTLQIERQLTKQLENMEISKDTSTLQPNPENKHDEQSNPLTSPSSQPGCDQLTSQQAQQRAEVSNSPPSCC